jgi:hypothetical protein
MVLASSYQSIRGSTEKILRRSHLDSLSVGTPTASIQITPTGTRSSLLQYWFV